MSCDRGEGFLIFLNGLSEDVTALEANLCDENVAYAEFERFLFVDTGCFLEKPLVSGRYELTLNVFLLATFGFIFGGYPNRAVPHDEHITSAIT